MWSICMQACSQSFSPLVVGRVNNALQQSVPDINKALLQLSDAIKLIPVLLKPEIVRREISKIRLLSI